MIANQIKPDMTESILKCISKHISNRRDCKDVEYDVNVFGDGKITLFPEVLVFDDIHNRRPVNRKPLLDHIIDFHCDPKFVSVVMNSNDEVHSRNFQYVIPGHYVYKYSSSGKCRRWIKLIWFVIYCGGEFIWK